jgi:hypothetical protein
MRMLRVRLLFGLIKPFTFMVEVLCVPYINVLHPNSTPFVGQNVKLPQIVSVGEAHISPENFPLTQNIGSGVPLFRAVWKFDRYFCQQ